MMAMNMKKLAVVAFVLVLCPGLAASAATFSQYVAFGDSTIDSGWWAGALVGNCGPATAPCATGNTIKDDKIAAAIANGGTGAPVGVGLMSSQVLAAKYGLTANPANQPGGTNYAISGALSARVGTSGNLNPNDNLPSVVEQISAYLASVSNVANPNALYEISSGGNDRTYAADNFTTLADRQTFLSGQALALATAVKSLQDAGAQTILVRGAPGSATLPTFWTSALFDALTSVGVNFIGVDMVSLVQNVLANPTDYGFTPETVVPGVSGSATGSACVAGLGAVGWGQWCGNTTTPNPNFSHLRTATSEQTSFYSDDQHFSAAGQAIVAQYEYDLIESQLNPVPLPGALPLFAGGLSLVAFAARRSRRRAA
jgi:outer membrane lipase/esterase